MDYPEENINTNDLDDAYELENDFFTDFSDKGATGGVLSKSVLKNFIKKETLIQVFSCEFCEIFKNSSGRLLLYQ